MERHQNGVDQALLLPGRVIRAAQCDEDVIGPEHANRILERGQRCLVPDLRTRVRPRRELLDVTQHDPEALVCLESGPIRVGREPAKPPNKHGRDDKDLGRGLDEPLDESRQPVELGDSFPGHDQKACPAGRHAEIMPDGTSVANASPPRRRRALPVSANPEAGTGVGT